MPVVALARRVRVFPIDKLVYTPTHVAVQSSFGYKLTATMAGLVRRSLHGLYYQTSVKSVSSWHDLNTERPIHQLINSADAFLRAFRLVLRVLASTIERGEQLYVTANV